MLTMDMYRKLSSKQHIVWNCSIKMGTFEFTKEDKWGKLWLCHLKREGSYSPSPPHLSVPVRENGGHLQSHHHRSGRSSGESMALSFPLWLSMCIAAMELTSTWHVNPPFTTAEINAASLLAWDLHCRTQRNACKNTSADKMLLSGQDTGFV